MNLLTFLREAADAFPDRPAIASGQSRFTFGELLRASIAAGNLFRSHGSKHAIVLDVNSLAIPVMLFGAAFAEIPYVPLNYRKTDAELNALVRRASPALIVGNEAALSRISPLDSVAAVARDAFLRAAGAAISDNLEPSGDGAQIAVQLFTSGTTGAAKAAILRHDHLMAYILNTVDFASASEDEANLVTAPPYHIAAIVAVLMSARSCRRMVMMDSFEPRAWLDLCEAERITHGFLVPTMLSRILETVVAHPGQWDLSRLRSIRYGGGKMPLSLIRKAMDLLPNVDFTNTYGMTEASSTICALGPEDHRKACASQDPTVNSRLGSVGRPIKAIEIEIRNDAGRPLPAGMVGQIHARGVQISGEYLDRGSQLDAAGWFWTYDRGYLDAAGYLFLDGRSDDVIVRGGENISPGEIEDVLLTHPAVGEAAVVAIADDEWGEAIAAVIVPRAGCSPSVEELQLWVRQELRSSRVPKLIEFRSALPCNDMGKVLRRVLRDELAGR
jgi:long-chain acyl-CoA synthetase